MTVVLRCPNCGTTQATAGECEACHEAQVRYFCTNHDPGIWLTGPTCAKCAARAVAGPATATRSPSPPPRPRATLDLGPSRPALSEKWLRGAALARRLLTPAARATEREPASLGPPSGWLLRLVLRLVLIGVALVVALLVAVYWVARSMY